MALKRLIFTKDDIEKANGQIIECRKKTNVNSRRVGLFGVKRRKLNLSDELISSTFKTIMKNYA